jgi:LytR cell envelope-related transcriptional attenuator
MTRQLARRHRRDRLVGVGLGVVGLAVLVVAVFALRSPNGHGPAAGRSTAAQASTPNSSSSHSSLPPARSTPTAPKTSASRSAPRTRPATVAALRLPLVVLNNTTAPGLAQLAKSRFEADGWTVTSIGNMTNDILSTCAYYDPTQTGAQAAARALQAQFPAIKRVVPKFAQLPPGPIVVVLTTDYS